MPASWDADRIEAGRADCDRRLRGLNVRLRREDPIKEGSCGLPAPVRLQSFEFDDAPDATFAPAPILSCGMVEALRRWLDAVVQPQAKARLDATVIVIATASDYNCRSRFGPGGEKLSQHAFANALDISAFITAKGERIDILESWDAGDDRALFLHAIHDGACRIFGTTLGPPANDSHKDHFHLDMTDRRERLCDFTQEQLLSRATGNAK